MYNIAFYWTVTTITTVGYGDISIVSDVERIYCSLIMITGVLAFSFANSSLTSIISNVDSSNALIKEKNEVFNTIKE